MSNFVVEVFSDSMLAFLKDSSTITIDLLIAAYISLLKSLSLTNMK